MTTKDEATTNSTRRDAWDDAVMSSAPRLWSSALAGLDAGLAIDVGHLAFLRLADSFSQIDEPDRDGWLASIAIEQRQIQDQQPWRSSRPFLGSSEEALLELQQRALTADPDVGGTRRVAVMARNGAEGSGSLDLVSTPWRDGEESPAAPNAIWVGAFNSDVVTGHLVLIDDRERRLLGVIDRGAVARCRVRSSTGWSTPDRHGRVNLGTVGSGPLSVEVETGTASVVTQWVLA